LFATVVCGLKAKSKPGWADFASANLTPASGRQDHTTSPSAATSLVSVLSIAHRPKPALQPRCAQNAAASTASRPASVTIAIRPSVGWDAKSSRCDLGWTETEIFLQRGLDTPVNKPPVGQISKYVRMGLSEAHPRHKMQLMGIAEFIIGPVEDRTRWLNPSYALLRAHHSNMLVAACSMSAMTPTATKNCSAAQ